MPMLEDWSQKRVILKCQYQYCHKSLDFVLRACCLQKFFTFSKTSALISILEFFSIYPPSVSWTVGFSFFVFFQYTISFSVSSCVGIYMGAVPTTSFPQLPPTCSLGQTLRMRLQFPKIHMRGPFRRKGVCMSPVWISNPVVLYIEEEAMLKSLFYYCICAGPHCCCSFKTTGIKKTSLCHLSTFHLSLFQGLGSCYFLEFNPYSAP